MSTKNLARTVIEGGRYRWALLALPIREPRAARRARASRLARGRGAAMPDDLTIRPVWKVGRWFHDKLGPSVRWLASQVGRPWDLVRGELVAQVRPADDRRAPHRLRPHASVDHGRGHVRLLRAPLRLSSHFLIDRHGLLRRVRPRPRYVAAAARTPAAPRARARRVAARPARGRARRRAVLVHTDTRPAATASTTVSTTPTPRSGDPLPDWFRACHDPCGAAGPVIPNGGADMPSITIKGRNVPIELWAPSKRSTRR